MSGITVRLQLSDHDNTAGDWANRSVYSSGHSGTGWMRTQAVTDNVRRDELILRLFDLRGAIESIKSDAYSPSWSANRSVRAGLQYGDPLSYHGMVFRVG